MILACACRGPWILAVDCCIQSDIVAIQSHGEDVCLYAVWVYMGSMTDLSQPRNLASVGFLQYNIRSGQQIQPEITTLVESRILAGKK